MKKTLVFIISVLLFGMIACPVQAAQDPIHIPIVRTTPPGENVTRTPELNPFVAEYSDILSEVMLGSNASIGDVTVTLVSTAGDWYQTVFDTSEGAILIPASGDSGHYTLTLVTQDGHTFVGEFDL